MANEGPTGNENVDRLLRALCCLDSPEEARAFLTDLCTQREIADLAQRLEVASLLAQKESYLGVSKLTGASSTTVSRVSKCLNGSEGGYRLVLERMAQAQLDAEEDAGPVPNGTSTPL